MRDSLGNALTGQRGAALVAVMLVSLLVSAVSVGAWSLTRVRLHAAERRIAQTEADLAARSTLAIIASWFEHAERGGLIAPPTADDVTQSLREIDRDGNGTGDAWQDADPPWNTMYKQDSGDLFRPPDDGGARHLFLGTPNGPDVLLSRTEGETAASRVVLEELGRLVDTEGLIEVVRVALFRPPTRAGEQALASIEVTTERKIAGRIPVRRTARGEVVKVPWGRRDRPVSVAGDAEFRGDAEWARGEAFVGGDLTAPVTTVNGWPGGVPWLAPDRPLRDDADADGTPDDVDGDGTDDLAGWRRQDGGVPDPWFRARIAGAWDPIAPFPAPCDQPFPFGPRAVPATAASRSGDRSGLFAGCPLDDVPPVVLPAWPELARSGRRGTVHVVESDDAAGLFRLDSAGQALPLESFLTVSGGLVVASGNREPGDPPLSIALPAWRGGLIVTGLDLRVRGDAPVSRTADAPGDPVDTRGVPRAASAADDHLPVVPRDFECRSFDVGTWVVAGDPGVRTLRHGCLPAPCDVAGLLAVSGSLRIDGPWSFAGQVRAGTLVADGEVGRVRLAARAASGDDAAARPGPFGAPRVVLTDVRTGP